LLYKKIKKKEEIELPGFKIKIPERIFELPEVEDITKLDVTYPLIEPFTYVNIKWNPEEKVLVYNVIEPELSEEEEKLLTKISEALVELIEVGFTKIKNVAEAIKYLEEQVLKVIKEFGIKLTPNQFAKIMYYIYRNFVGFNEIEPLLNDPNIEDISCDGVGLPVYIIHRKYGSLRTNIIFKDVEKLRDLVIKLAERCGRYVSYAEPILAGTLPDGSRVSATLASDVATRGPVFTIRKFGVKPFSPIDQINLKTANSEIMAYLWYLIEHKACILVVGGVATGKTSFLNTIAMFIPPEAKIVSIEDTREIKLVHEHWIPGLARVGFGIPMPTGEKYGEVTLFDLLKESFRQNPDYVIVGEVRGKETYVMFQGMASGHPCLSTFHAGSLDTVVKRLITPPISLPITLLESLDVIVVMQHAKEKGKSARRIKEIIEILSVERETGEIVTNIVFEWDSTTDSYKKVNESKKIEKFALAAGATREDAIREIEIRKKIIEWLLREGITDYLKVIEVINTYYKQPEKILSRIKEVREVKIEKKPKPEVKVERRRIGLKELLEKFGFGLIRERA
jgi:flagellar protein FlaI